MRFAPNLIFLLSLSCIYGSMAQNITNETLIYSWDPHHKISLYCYFASEKHLKNYEQQCFKKYANMQHTLADGTKTFPYFGHGSPFGFILKCGDIPHGKLESDCTRYVQTTCSYTCGTSDAVHTMRCNLVGPWVNVTAQWSVKEPCIEPTIVLLQITPDPFVKPATGGKANDDIKTVIIAVTVVGALTVMAVAGAFCFHRWKNKQNQRHSQSSSDEPLNAGTSSQQEELKETKPLITDPDKEGQRLLQAALTAGTSSLQDELKEAKPLITDPDREGQSSLQAALIAGTISQQEELKEVKLLVTDPARQGDITEEPHPQVGSDAENAIMLQEPLACPGNSNPQIGIAEIQDKMIDCDYCYPENAGIQENGQPQWSEFTSKFCLEPVMGVSDGEKNEIFVKTAQGENMAATHPDMCNAAVKMFRDQTHSYRKKLRAELEVIPDRSRKQALIGYVEDNAQALGYSRNEIKMLERSCESNVDEKVSDLFLNRLAEYGTKVGSLIKYFYTHGNMEAIAIILDVHKGCEFCERFRNSN